MIEDSAKGMRESQPFGTDEFGETLYWPDESHMTIRVPAPLEQFLEEFADFLGETAEEAGVYLLRAAIMDRLTGGVLKGFRPSRRRYLENVELETEVEDAG